MADWYREERNVGQPSKSSKREVLQQAGHLHNLRHDRVPKAPFDRKPLAGFPQNITYLLLKQSMCNPPGSLLWDRRNGSAKGTVLLLLAVNRDCCY